MCSQNNYMEENFTKNDLDLAKTDRVSRYTFSVLKLRYSQHN